MVNNGTASQPASCRPTSSEISTLVWISTHGSPDFPVPDIMYGLISIITKVVNDERRRVKRQRSGCTTEFVLVPIGPALEQLPVAFVEGEKCSLLDHL